MEGNKKISEDHFILQSDIDKFFTCSNRNKMKFHPSKSKVLSITNQRNILHNLPLSSICDYSTTKISHIFCCYKYIYTPTCSIYFNGKYISIGNLGYN